MENGLLFVLQPQSLCLGYNGIEGNMYYAIDLVQLNHLLLKYTTNSTEIMLWRFFLQNDNHTLSTCRTCRVLCQEFMKLYVLT